MEKMNIQIIYITLTGFISNTGAAEATFNRSGQSSSSILQKKGLRESIRIQQCFVDFRARFCVIALSQNTSNRPARPVPLPLSYIARPLICFQ